MRIVKQYYLVPFISLVIICFLAGLGIKSPNSFLYNLIVVLVLSMIGTLIIGTVWYLQDTRWGPAKRKKKLLKPPLLNLFDFGFREMEEMMAGIRDGYTVFVYYTWETGKQGIRIDVLYNPYSLGQLIGFEDLDLIIKRQSESGFMKKYEMQWTRNAFGTVMEYTFIPPKMEEVIQKIDRVIAMLKDENLKPYSMEEAEKWIQQIQ